MAASYGTCTIEGCEKEGRLRRGMCGAHYEKARRDGAFTDVICKQDECPAKGTYRGYCSKHYQQVKLKSPESLPAKTVADRFWPLVEKTETCWLWVGTLSEKGYGRFRDNNRLHQAHRISYGLTVGPIPDGMMLDHACHNKSCVNPEHLRPATTQWNAEYRKGPNANNSSGYRNVSWHCQSKKWWAVIRSDGVQHSMGLFDDPYEAHLAVVEKRRELHHWDAPDNRTA